MIDIDINTLSEHDKELLEKVKKIENDYTAWGYVLDYSKEFENEELREYCRSLGVRLYHKEEASCNCI